MTSALIFKLAWSQSSLRAWHSTAWMGGDLGHVLVVDDAQLERFSMVQGSVVVVGSSSNSVRVH
jgi:hypothetical protein